MKNVSHTEYMETIFHLHNMHSIIRYIHWQQHIVQCLLSICHLQQTFSDRYKKGDGKCVQQSPTKTRKPSCRWQTRTTQKHAKIAPIRRAYNAKFYPDILRVSPQVGGSNKL